MEDQMSPFPEEEPKKDNKNIWIIVGVIVILCCCCLAMIPAVQWLWNNGDSLLGISALLQNI